MPETGPIIIPEINPDEELAAFKEKQVIFEAAYAEAKRTGQVTDELLRLEAELDEHNQRFWEAVWPFEHLKQEVARQQYEVPLNILRSRHDEHGPLLESRDGHEFIRDHEGNEYPVPTFEQYTQVLVEQREIVERKAEQGFIPRLVPFAIPLRRRRAAYGRALAARHAAGTLLGSDGNPIDLDTATPVGWWTGYEDADTKQPDAEGKIEGEYLVYEDQAAVDTDGTPLSFAFTKTNHHGKRKAELLAQSRSGKTPGWQIILMEDLPNIPRASRPDKDVTVGDRVQLKAGKSPNEYRATIGKKGTPYEYESGATPDDWFTYADLELELHGRVTDDYDTDKGGQGSIAYLPGAWFPAAGRVPYAFWRRRDRRARLDGHGPDVVGERCGVRSRVRLS